MKSNKNIQAVICPPCGENVALATKRGLFNKRTFFTTPHRPYGALPPQVGKLTTHGFTLIELLVVVLIIVILAAVAVPQYQKAVEKARISEAVVLLSDVAKAQKIYFLANGEYTDNWNDLDISLNISVDPNSLTYAVAQHTSLYLRQAPQKHILYAQSYPVVNTWRIYYFLDEEKMFCATTNNSDFCKSYSDNPTKMCGTLQNMKCYEMY